MTIERPPEAYDFTIDDIAEYLDVPADEHLHSLGMLETCIAVIARYESDHDDYNGAIVEAAARSLFQWMSDYDIDVNSYSVPNQNPQVNQMVQLGMKVPTHHVIRRTRPKMENGFATWTPELESDLAIRALSGVSTEDLAIEFGRSIRAIQQRLNLLGLRHHNGHWRAT